MPYCVPFLEFWHKRRDFHFTAFVANWHSLFLKDTNKMDTLVYTFHFRLQDQTKKHLLFMLCYTFRQLYFCFHLNFLLLKFFVPNSIKNVLSQWHFQVKHFPSLLFLTNKFHQGLGIAGGPCRFVFLPKFAISIGRNVCKNAVRLCWFQV